MSFMMRQFLKYGINVLDKEDVTQDQIEYVYKKWGQSVAERLVKMLEDETSRARETLERLKQSSRQARQK
jgi:hypothetical protein